MGAVFRQSPFMRLTALLLLIFAFPAWAGERVVLQLKWRHAFQFAGYYAAEAKGFYRDVGLDVQFREAKPETNVVEEVASEQADFGVGNSDLLVARKNGLPVVVLAAIFQHSPLVFITSGKLTQVRQLTGKQISFEPQSVELEAYLAREAVVPAGVEHRQSGFAINDLQAGRVDAISAYSTSEPYFLGQVGYDFRVFSPRSVGIDFYGDSLFTVEDKLKRRPQLVRDFRAASLRGWAYAMAHPDEIIDLIRLRYAPDLPREYLAFEAADMAELLRPDLVALGHMSEVRWQRIGDIYAEAGLLPRDFPLAGFIYNPETIADQGVAYLYLFAALVALLVVSGLAIYAFRANRSLRISRTDLSDQREELLLQNQILEMINRARPLAEVLEALARSVEANRPGCLCSILLLEDGCRLRHAAAPSLPAAYNQVVDGLAIGLGIGSCGEAAFTGARVVVEDIQRHPNWRGFEAHAAAAGVRSCWSQPFCDSQGRVIGTFAMYHREPASPNASEIALIENYARLALLAIERANEHEALRLGEERFRLISQNSSDVIWMLDFPSLRFSYVSPAVQRLRGWTPEEVMAQPMEAALMPESARRVRLALEEQLQRLAAGDRSRTFQILEVDQPHKDGSVISTEVVTNLLLDNETGQLRQILGISRDISERRRSEVELARYRDLLERRVEERTQALSVAKEAAEAANRAKSTFLANMSHELRTPMSAIMGMTELALRREVDPLQKGRLENVDRAARHLLDLINDILDLSKIEAERLRLESVPFHLSAVMADIEHLVRHDAERKQLTLTFSVEPSLEAACLCGDPARLRQVLLNLVGNAIKFTEHGEVAVSVARDASSGDEVHLRFEIRDTGIGIAAADQRRLFNPFVQADDSMSRRFGGTGLGLAISRRLAMLMNGNIGVESEPGQGSLFWFTATLLPSAVSDGEPDELSAEAAEAALREHFSGARILLAEDEAITQEIFRELLGGAGLIVEFADDGLQALEQVQQQPYDLILMDMLMPRMSGIEATRAIRALPGRGAVPIIAITANAYDDDRRACLAAGMNDHISKPVAPAHLFATLLRWLARQP